MNFKNVVKITNKIIGKLIMNYFFSVFVSVIVIAKLVSFYKNKDKMDWNRIKDGHIGEKEKFCELYKKKGSMEIPPEIENHIEVLKLKVFNDYRNYFHIEYKYKDNIELFHIAAMSNYSVIHNAPYSIRDNTEICRKILKKKPMYLQYVSDRLRSDEEFVKEIIKIDKMCFQHASIEIRNNPEFCLMLCDENIERHTILRFGKEIKDKIKRVYKCNICDLEIKELFKFLKFETIQKYNKRKGKINFYFGTYDLKFNFID